jgi:hypothetical protein
MRKGTVALIALLALSLSVSAQETVLRVGGSEGWSSDLRSARNVSFISVQESPDAQPVESVRIASARYSPGPATDLLLHFDDGFTDAAGHYSVRSLGSAVSELSRIGSGAASFADGDEEIRLIPRSGAFFAPGSASGDFSIEFWLYVTNLGADEPILSWSGARLLDGSPVGQYLTVEKRAQRLHWDLENLFLPADRSRISVRVSGRRQLIPRRWQHHLLRFDSRTGLLEYRVDGVPEDIVYATSSGRESGERYLPVVGRAASDELVIGGGFVGLMDELRITRRAVEEVRLHRYDGTIGVVETRTFDFGDSGSRLDRIESDARTPGNTDLAFYYRLGSGDSSRVLDELDWVPYRLGDPIDREGRYAQVRVELLADGSWENSPVLRSLSVFYTPDEPPAPPQRVSAQPGNNAVTLRWADVPETDVAGYWVFYGERPGRYFGEDADRGTSPIDVGNVNEVTLSGLENGRLYYFAVAAYDESIAPGTTTLSSEVSARPSQIHQ